MKKHISDWVSFPLIAFLVGFFIVGLPNVWYFVLFGLILAFIRQSSLQPKHKSWLQGGMWLTVTLSIPILLFWNTFTQDEFDKLEYLRSVQPVPDYSTDTHNGHELEYIRFWYPRDRFESQVHSGGAVQLYSLEKITRAIEELPERMYTISESQTEVTDFETYADQYAQRVHGWAADFGLRDPLISQVVGGKKYWILPSVYAVPHYEIQTDNYNGMPVVIEQANFGGQCGNIYRITFWLGAGRLASLESDCYGTYPDRPDIDDINEIVYSFEIK